MKATLRSTPLPGCVLLALTMATAVATDLRIGLVDYWPMDTILQTTNLAGGTWVPAESGTNYFSFGQSALWEFPIQPSQTQLRYRVADPVNP
jgi:hypothetical protein